MVLPVRRRHEVGIPDPVPFPLSSNRYRYCSVFFVICESIGS